MNLPASTITQQSIEFLFNGKEQVILPFYQREYSWTTKEVDELFDDILSSFEEAKNTNSINDGYLLGNIVFLTFDKKNLYLLDGQQRLTTLFIIFDEIINSYIGEYNGIIQSIERFIYNVDFYGNKSSSFKIKRELQDKSIIDININEDIDTYIRNKAHTHFLYNGFDDENEILDFLLNLNFIIQKYISNSTDLNFQNKIFKNILNYFIKFNTRGKPFSKQEIENAISFFK